jgi:enamine deaminase RidA (YjgF/YER057c/UK114 family)
MVMHRVFGLGLSALLVAAPAAARDPARVIMPTDPAALAQQQQYGYADAVIAGDMIYLSGVIVAPRPGEVGLEAAYVRAFDRIGNTLKRAGASFDDVVDMTSYHVDLAGTVEAMTAVKNRYIKGPPPAWTAIGIVSLFEKEGVTEIRITAYKPR